MKFEKVKSTITYPNCKLRNERLNRALSQQELADQIGTTITNVSRWERGITEPRPYFRVKLCNIFEKTPEDLGLQLTPYKQSTAFLDHAPFNPLALIPDTHAEFYVRRECLQNQLMERIYDVKTSATLALCGLPGIGKTTLLLQIIRNQALQKQFDGNIFWVTLGPNPNICELLRQWGLVLQISEDELSASNCPETLARILNRHLEKMRVLFIIDNVWKIEDALAFKVGGCTSKYVITTRFPKIAIQFATRNVLQIPELSRAEALYMARYLLSQLSEICSQEIEQLVSVSNGHPFLIKLIAEYLQQVACYNQPRRLHEVIAQFCSCPRTRLKLEYPLSLIEKSTFFTQKSVMSLYDLINTADHLLEQKDRKALSALTVFPQKPAIFSEEAALAVIGALPKTLDTLCDLGFLEGHTPGYYCLSPIVADYASLQLTDNDASALFIDYIKALLSTDSLLERSISPVYLFLQRALKYAEHLNRLSDKEDISQALAAIQ